MRHAGKRMSWIMGNAKLRVNIIVEKELFLYSDKTCYHKADKDRGLIVERGRLHRPRWRLIRRNYA